MRSSSGGIRRLAGGQFSDALPDGMEFGDCEAGQFGDDLARAHDVRNLCTTVCGGKYWFSPSLPQLKTWQRRICGGS
jgi:hypothetical protein